MKLFPSRTQRKRLCFFSYAILFSFCLLCSVAAGEKDGTWDERTKTWTPKFTWKRFGEGAVANAPAHIKASKEKLAMYVAAEVAEEMNRRKVTPNYNVITRITHLFSSSGTCVDAADTLEEALSGAGFSKECRQLIVNSDSYGPNRNHVALAVAVDGKIVVFDPWQHGRTTDTFKGFIGSKWNGMTVDEWLSEMKNQGYKEVSSNQGLDGTYHPLNDQNAIDSALEPLNERVNTHARIQRNKEEQQKVPGDKDKPPVLSDGSADVGKKADVKVNDIKDTRGDSPGDEGKSIVKDFQSKLDEMRNKKDSSGTKEKDLMDAEGSSKNENIYDLVSMLYQSGKKTYESGRGIAGSWWESFFGSSEEKNRREFEAVQSSSDVVMGERRSAMEAEHGRRQNEVAQQEIAMQNWLASISSAYESARAEAQWKRENSWGAWAQSVLMDTVKGVSGGFGSGFGNRIGSGIIEHEIAKRYPEENSAPPPDTSQTVQPVQDDRSSKGSSGGKKDDKQVTSVPSGKDSKDKSSKDKLRRSRNKAKNDQTVKTKPVVTTPTRPVPGQPLRTIDGKPFQPPPDGRNTANEISPTAAKPPAPAHWFCMHCGGDRGVDGSGACGCRPAGIGN